jgi:hypothetical protein
MVHYMVYMFTMSEFCLLDLLGTLNLGVGNPNGISFTLFLVVHNFSFVDWALLEELQSPFCLLVAFPD